MGHLAGFHRRTDWASGSAVGHLQSLCEGVCGEHHDHFLAGDNAAVVLMVGREYVTPDCVWLHFESNLVSENDRSNGGLDNSWRTPRHTHVDAPRTKGSEYDTTLERFELGYTGSGWTPEAFGTGFQPPASHIAGWWSEGRQTVSTVAPFLSASTEDKHTFRRNANIADAVSVPLSPLSDSTAPGVLRGTEQTPGASHSRSYTRHSIQIARRSPPVVPRIKADDSRIPSDLPAVVRSYPRGASSLVPAITASANARFSIPMRRAGDSRRGGRWRAMEKQAAARQFPHDALRYCVDALPAHSATPDVRSA